MWYLWAIAWPLPQEMSQRFTGSATKNATTKDTAKLAQNSPLVSPAVIAPGTASMKMLSANSIVVIDAVSAANATFIAC